MKALFIPLKAEFFEAFERGEKDTEYREIGPRWNVSTCFIGRKVVLSYGYGKRRRLEGEIVGYDHVLNPQKNIPGWSKCYGHNRTAAAIKIKLTPQPS